MGIMQTCCCCCRLSIRRGSYVSAIYTIVYFMAFALLTGNMAFLEIETWLENHHHASSLGDGQGHNNTSTLTGASGSRLAGTGTRGMTKEAMEHGYDDTNLSVNDPKYAPTQSPPFSVVVILIDFVCELCGFFASMLLIRGLQQERKSLLIPWMIAVPTHTLIDAYTACDIVIAFFRTRYKDPQESGQDSYGTVILFLAVTLTSVINIYALVCVISQYQEFSEGRGTASFEAMLMNNGSVRYTSGGERVSIRQSNRPIQKSDIWLDDIGFGKSSAISKNRRESQGNGNPGGSNLKSDRVPTVRFENESSSSSGGDSAEPRQRFLGNYGKSDKDSFGVSLIVPSKNSNRGAVMEMKMEESTTADSIEEM